MLKLKGTEQLLFMDIWMTPLIPKNNIIPLLPQQLNSKRKKDFPRGLLTQSAGIILAIFFQARNEIPFIKALDGIIPNLSQVCFEVSQSLNLCRMDSSSLWHKGQISDSLLHLFTKHSPTPMLLCKHCQMKVLTRGIVSSFHTQLPLKSSSFASLPIAKAYAYLRSKSPRLAPAQINLSSPWLALTTIGIELISSRTWLGMWKDKLDQSHPFIPKTILYS